LLFKLSAEQGVESIAAKDLRKLYSGASKSLKELELVSGRKRSNLSRTLNTMSRYGIVHLVKQNRAVKPIVIATDFKVEFGLNTAMR